MKTKKYLILFAALLFIFSSCEEEGRYVPGNSGGTPNKVTNVTYKELYGGARFFYTVPGDEDLLQIQAEYTNERGDKFLFTSSYFVDSLDVYGFASVKEYTVDLYAVNRAGVRSEVVKVGVTPLEPAYTRVAKSVVIKPGFKSFFLDWENELEQNINVYVDFEYTQSGNHYSFTQVFASNLLTDRRFVTDLDLTNQDAVSIKVMVEDLYGNATEYQDFGNIYLLEDVKIPKDNWMLPEPNDSTVTVNGTVYNTGIPMCFGNAKEGRNRYVIDDAIDRGDNLNFMHTDSYGRTGNSGDGNMPWNFIIDLGDYYELSRIITVQRHSGGLNNISRGQYYQYENVGHFKIYILDETTGTWEYITEHKIPVPEGISEIEFVKLGEAGDMAYMYPDDPQYTRATRWVRYEAFKGFTDNYTREDANCLSEISYYGRKATR